MKRFILLLAVILFLVPVTSSSQTTAIVFEEITVDGTARGFSAETLGKLATRSLCRGRLETTATARFMYHGGTPTASSGELVDVGDRVEITGLANITNFKIIKASGDDGKLVMTCGR